MKKILIKRNKINKSVSFKQVQVTKITPNANHEYLMPSPTLIHTIFYSSSYYSRIDLGINRQQRKH